MKNVKNVHVFLGMIISLTLFNCGGDPALEKTEDLNSTSDKVFALSVDRGGVLTDFGDENPETGVMKEEESCEDVEAECFDDCTGWDDNCDYRCDAKVRECREKKGSQAQAR